MKFSAPPRAAVGPSAPGLQSPTGYGTYGWPSTWKRNCAVKGCAVPGTASASGPWAIRPVPRNTACVAGGPAAITPGRPTAAARGPVVSASGSAGNARAPRSRRSSARSARSMPGRMPRPTAALTIVPVGSASSTRGPSTGPPSSLGSAEAASSAIGKPSPSRRASRAGTVESAAKAKSGSCTPITRTP